MKDGWCARQRGRLAFVPLRRCLTCLTIMNNSSESRPSCEGNASMADATAMGHPVPSWKRALDIFCVLVTSIIWVPLWLMIGLYVKIVSPGPILFRQKRIGHLAKEFFCLKFRTMRPDADAGVHQTHVHELIASNRPMHKLDGARDARLIPGGRWLRALGMDELPQLINILRGEMSLVGPRPCVAYEYEMFLPRHRRRCATLPGLTGLWQVRGKNRTTFEKMMDLDLEYVERKSLLLDFQIIACTLPAILLQVRDLSQSPQTTAAALPAVPLPASFPPMALTSK
jgi:lipopolysaccharide/colanic/teichoic acid biosynthesis glycosyltransferase